MNICLFCRFVNPPTADTCVQCRRYKFPSVQSTSSDTPKPEAAHPSTKSGPVGRADGGAFDQPAETNRGESEVTAAVQIGPHLEVIRGDQPGVSFALITGRNVVGRQPGNGIRVDLTDQEPPDAYRLSREHACIHVDFHGLVIEDLGSQNGTFVNRNRVPPGGRRAIRAGDIIQVGTVQLKLHVPDWQTADSTSD